MTKEHSIRNIFKKDKTPDNGSATATPSYSHTGLSKLFHKESKPITPPMKRTPSVSSLKRRNTNPSQTSGISLNHNHHHHQDSQNHNDATTSGGNIHSSTPVNRSRSNSDRLGHVPPTGRKVLSKAETFTHLQQLDTRNAAKNQLRNHRIPSNHLSSPLSAAPHSDKIVYNPYGLNKTATQERPKNTSFYLSGVNDGERVLSNPVASPNDYLPAELQQQHVNLLEDFEIDVGTKKLGDGGSSDVRIINSCHHKKDLYALKKFTLLSKETDEDFYKRVLEEYKIHRKAAISRHVVDAFAILRIQSQSNLTRGWGMVMEFCGGGDLFSVIVKPGWKSTPLAEKYCLFKQIAYGVKFLHDHDIVHRDLKPENVLLDANGLAKLCDFGVSEFGHEVPEDFSSPVKLSTAYVGSPPYAPPEVMLLKEKSSTEIKAFAYDPFKMDCWGLGMLLFCLVYGGVPFQQSSPNDHAFRDYKFSHKRFCTDHHTFKSNQGYPRGPGSEFKLAAKFENNGASRVAWKLCDPSENTRYTMDMLFDDPWFQSVEMCIYESPDQEVNPFVLPGTGENIDTHSVSGYSSVNNSQAPSRRGTFTSRPVGSGAGSGYNSHDESSNGLSSSFRSMLDLKDIPQKITKTDEPLPSNSSVHSNDSSSARAKSKLDHPSSPGSLLSPSTPALQSIPADRVAQTTSPINASLPAVEESDIEHESESEIQGDETESLGLQVLPPIDDVVAASPSSLTHEPQEQVLDSVESCISLPPNRDQAFAGKDGEMCSLVDLKPAALKSATDLQLGADGMCNLGYKIKKHHHTEVSNVSNSSRR